MSTPLFLDKEHKQVFTKIAMPVKLSDSPDAWQREIASEVFKQVPFIGEYAVNVIVDRVDPERGFAFGSAQVSSNSEAPEEEQAALPTVRIPLIVKDRLLQPMDVFMDGKGVFPLTEARLREHLFRADTFETSNRKPEDRGMADQLYPPMRSNYGNNMMSMGEGTMGKFAEAQDPMAYARKLKAEGSAQKFASLTEAIASTIPPVEADEFVSQIASDQPLQIAAAGNPAFQKLAMIVASSNNAGVEKTAEALVKGIKPTVIQFEKLASGEVKMKWANADAYSPQEATMSGQEAGQMAGSDKVQDMSPGSMITLSTTKAKKTSLDDAEIELIKDYGYWKAWDASTNEEVSGWAIPVMDFEMHPMEMFVFLLDDGRYAVQDEIAGMRLHHDPGPSEAIGGGQTQPQGDGCFVKVGQSVTALFPMTIQNASQGPDGSVEYHGSTMLGEQVVLSLAPGLQSIEKLDENHYAIPDDLTWMALNGDPVFLMKDPAEVENLTQAQQAPNTLEMRSTGPGEFSMDGPPVEKIAKEQRWFVKKADAEFLLVGMGVNPFEARVYMDSAQKNGLVKIAGVMPLTPLADVHRTMVKQAAKLLDNFPYGLRRNLVKEAAALEDSETADKILAMNFINPENISTFAKYLPELDETASKLAEMLVAARLGMSQLPEGAVERAMKNLEDVIQGLKALHQKELI
jgi:hypothetical protein